MAELGEFALISLYAGNHTRPPAREYQSYQIAQVPRTFVCVCSEALPKVGTFEKWTTWVVNKTRVVYVGRLAMRAREFSLHSSTLCNIKRLYGGFRSLIHI